LTISLIGSGVGVLLELVSALGDEMNTMAFDWREGRVGCFPFTFDSFVAAFLSRPWTGFDSGFAVFSMRGL